LARGQSCQQILHLLSLHIYLLLVLLPFCLHASFLQLPFFSQLLLHQCKERCDVRGNGCMCTIKRIRPWRIRIRRFLCHITFHCSSVELLRYVANFCPNVRRLFHLSFRHVENTVNGHLPSTLIDGVLNEDFFRS